MAIRIKIGYNNNTTNINISNLKQFRSEAIWAGFSKLWKEKNYKQIAELAERLQEEIMQEDEKLLMYYDVSPGMVWLLWLEVPASTKLSPQLIWWMNMKTNILTVNQLG